jgi:hypothetical protein
LRAVGGPSTSKNTRARVGLARFGRTATLWPPGCTPDAGPGPLFEALLFSGHSSCFAYSVAAVSVAKKEAGNEIFETCRSYALRDQLVFIHDYFSECRNGQISLGQTSLPSPPRCKRKNRRQALRGRRARSEARVATMAALFVCGGCLSTPGASPRLPQEPRERLRTPRVDRK